VVSRAMLATRNTQMEMARDLHALSQCFTWRNNLAEERMRTRSRPEQLYLRNFEVGKSWGASYVRAGRGSGCGTT